MHNYGLNGYILQIDIQSYYPSMCHDVVKKKFERYLYINDLNSVCDILDAQCTSEIGYLPGSQMVQIAGISALDDLDHFCKERLHLKHYIRYMDDILILHDNKDILTDCLKEIENRLSGIGFNLNRNKTHITKLNNGFIYLGFKYRITSTGKIIMTINSANVKHERKKLFRLVKLAKQGKISKNKVDECFKSWCAHASKGNSYKLINRMKRYYINLWRCVNES